MIAFVLFWLQCTFPHATPFLHPRQGHQRLATTQLRREATARPRPLLARALAAAGGQSSVPRLEKPDKLGVLFLNLGGPEKLDDVEGFLYNLFADPDIIRLPPGVNVLQKPIAKYISKTRGVQARAAYQSIGGGSPIVRYTTEQAALVQQELETRGWNASCYFAMRYWNPMTDEVMAKIERDGIDTLVVVPLYPHYSLSTSGSSMKLLYKYFESHPNLNLSHTVVPYWFQRPGYIRTMSKLILHKLKEFTAEELQTGVDVLFSAHGVPQSYIALGDLYQRHIEECVLSLSDQVAAELRSRDPTCPNVKENGESRAALERLKTALDNNKLKFHLSYQSRVGPVEWLRPYTDDKIKEFGKAGVQNLAVVPIAFVSEHIETLEEIDGEYRELALESGIKAWKRVPALNTDKDFIIDLADMVEESLEAPVVSLADACILRGDKDQEKFAKNELRRELRYLNVSAFKDPISHLLGWRMGKVARRVGDAVTGIVSMVL